MNGRDESHLLKEYPCEETHKRKADEDDPADEPGLICDRRFHRKHNMQTFPKHDRQDQGDPAGASIALKNGPYVDHDAE